MNILVLTTILPSGKRSGGEIVTQLAIEALNRQGHRVTVLGYQPREREYQPQPQEIAIERRYIETDTAKYYPWLWMLSSFLRGLPYSAAKYYAPAYRHIATELLSGGAIDVVIFDHAQIGWLSDLPIPPHTRRILLAHNIERDLYLEQMRATRHPLWQRIYQREARSIGRMEQRLAASVDRVWTLSHSDADYFATIAPPDLVKVLDIPAAPSNPIDLHDSSSCDLAMLGTWTWQPNQDGLRWFFDRVYPQLPDRLSIRVAGKGADWLRDRYPNVEYCGFVADAREFIARARTIAIPAVAGAGVQIKTLEAIAAGVPIVATPTALRGIADYPPSVGVAATPAEFARMAIESIASPDRAVLRQAAISWSWRRWEQFDRDLAAELVVASVLRQTLRQRNENRDCVSVS